MSVDDYSALSTERLLEMFATAAKRFGFATSHLETLRRLRADLPIGPIDDVAERKQGALQVRAIGEALRARGTIPEAKRLMVDDDPNVRAAAAIFFAYVSPELAHAAMQGMFASRPTLEVLAAQRHARQPPPVRPTLGEMSNDEVVARFEDAAKRQSAADHYLDWVEDPKEMDVHNRLIDEVKEVLGELKSRNLLGRLQPLLDSSDCIVRLRAAQGCLRIAELEAVAAFESVARSGGIFERIDANEALDNWRKGKCLIDAL
jgi:HEAT repeat protein